MPHGNPETWGSAVLERRTTGVSHGTLVTWRRWRSNMAQLGLLMVLQRHGGGSARESHHSRFSWYSREMEAVGS